MSLKNLVKNIVEDVAVDLTQAFDRNFERKAFFDRSWKTTNHPNSRGSLLLRSGRLRKSIKSVRGNGSISWSSSLPYASIHNEGGEMVITQKMKSFFWAMYYKSAGAVTYSVKKKAPNNTQRNKKLSAEANKWKAMALLKVGTVIKVEQRQFIGWHPEVDRRIKKIVDHNMDQVNQNILKNLKK
jgi:phage gpG-like protein